jgi:hypothetical protein
MDIWRTRPHEPDTWTICAKCPWCGDKSFDVEIVGGFHVGGYGRLKEDDDETDFPSTVVDFFESDDRKFTFHLKKASADAKPYYRP